jgi:tRNA pseudouridine38-40 synthase
MKIKMLIAYDGTGYAGWQRQGPKSLDRRPTIQATIEDVLSKIFNVPIVIQTSGRTDAGVHAEGQVAHFKIPLNEDGKPVKDPLKMSFLKSVNAMTPDSISILKAWIAPNDFHALRSAEIKTYRYMIHNSQVRNPLTVRYSLWVRSPLDVSKLNALTEPLIGEHDFSSFRTRGTEVKSTIRRIIDARWEQLTPEVIQFRITGSGFLKQMVRNIVGTTLYLHQRGQGGDEMQKILAGKDRKEAKTTANPEGLFLESVKYPPELDNRCREL